MNMRFDKAGNGHSPLGVEREGRIPGSVTVTDAHDAAVGYFDITKAFASPQSNILDENIWCHRGELRGGCAAQCNQTLCDGNYRTDRTAAQTGSISSGRLELRTLIS